MGGSTTMRSGVRVECEQFVLRDKYFAKSKNALVPSENLDELVAHKHNNNKCNKIVQKRLMLLL